MTFNHDDFQRRLIDFVCGDLPADERAAFESHLASCAGCRGDVEGLRQSREAARAVVRAPLDEAVPPGVHARIMQAARQAVLARAATEGPAEPAKSQRAEARSDADPISERRWMAWLRERWTVPLFATVAAMGVLLLGREMIFREARRPLGETPPAELLPKESGSAAQEAAQAPGAAPGGRPAASAAEGEGKGALRGRERETKRAKPPTKSGSRAVAPPPPSAPALPRKRDRSVADDLGGGETSETKGTVAAKRSIATDTPSTAPPPAPARPASAVREPAQRSAASGAAAQAARDERPGLAPAAADLAKAAPAEASIRAEDEPAERRPQPTVGAADSALALAAQAEKLMDAQRWTEAAAVFREILQRFPRHQAAPAWRRRLAAAEAAARPPADPGRFAAPPPAR